MSIDYAELETTARTLVNDLGKSVTFRRLDDTPTDSNQPWRGNADPRGGGSDTIEGDAVAVPPSSATQLGFSTTNEDFVKRAEQILIAVVDAGAGSIEDYDEVTVEGAVYKINAIETLRPATTTLLYFVSIRR